MVKLYPNSLYFRILFAFLAAFTPAGTRSFGHSHDAEPVFPSGRDPKFGQRWADSPPLSSGEHNGDFNLTRKQHRLDFVVQAGMGLKTESSQSKTLQADGLVLIDRSTPFFHPNPSDAKLVLSTTLTTWNGSTWDSGLPEAGVSAQINGAYAGPGFVCEDLNVAVNASFTPSSEVTVRGNVQILNANTLGSIRLAGTSLQTIRGTFQDLTLANAAGAGISGATSIKGTLSLEAGMLTTNNQLTLTSTSSRTARVGRISPGATVNGNVLVRRFVPGTTASWHFMGVPVGNQTQADWSDNFTLLTNFIFSHNEAGSLNVDDQINGWEYAGQNLVPGKGYRTFLNQSFFNGNPVFDNNGPLISGPFSFPISFTPDGFDGGGWNFLSNPYACEVDWHAFAKTNIGGQVHLWNKNQYASYSQGAGLGVNGGSRYISAFQGFFVKASGENAALSINEEAKPLVPVSTNFLKINTTEGEVARITMRAPNGDKDETAIRWMPEASGFFEPEYDVDKLRNTGLTFFSNTGEGRPVAIQSRNFVESDSVLLGYQSATFGTHFLEIRIGSEVFEGKLWRLRDNMTGNLYPISVPEMLHSFDIPEGLEIMNYRFSLLLENPPVAVDPKVSQGEMHLFPNPGTDKLQVWVPGGNGQFRILDAHGRTSKSGRLSVSENRIETGDLPTGWYAVEVQTPYGLWMKKWLKAK